MTIHINKSELNKLTLEITERYKKIIELFPKENESILKHLAASAIHMTLFTRDLCEITHGIKFSKNELSENKFLEECGCKDIK